MKFIYPTMTKREALAYALGLLGAGERVNIVMMRLHRWGWMSTVDTDRSSIPGTGFHAEVFDDSRQCDFIGNCDTPESALRLALECAFEEEES